jgi:hypothetical protein
MRHGTTVWNEKGITQGHTNNRLSKKGKILTEEVALKYKNIKEYRFMTDNNNIMTAEDYITALGDLKANSIEKSEYERILAENAKLTNALASGFRQEAEVNEPEVDIPELRKKLLTNKYKNDMEYFKDMKTLRDAIVEKEGVDPFVNQAAENVSAEISNAEQVAQLIDFALEEANGDPVKFSAVFNSKLILPTVKK